MKNKPTVFISYSWDSKEHQEWVKKLVSDLMANGIEATFDQNETQRKTTNLYKMMISAFKDYDYVILVLTENYAKKSDNGEGGVGFETQFSYQFLNENENKLIFIAKGDLNKVFPLHLNGYYAIDFTNSNDYENKLQELINRIKNSDNKTNYSFDQSTKNEKSKIDNFEIPNIREITDIEKEKFMKESFIKIRADLEVLFSKMKEKNNNFEYMHEEVSLTKSIFKMYKNGNFIDGIKIWLCNFFRETTYNICFSYGNNIGNDNSLNEQLTYSITEDNELKLKYSFSSSFIDNNLFKANEIVNNIWESHVKKVITRN
jgi:hypothetical protein